MLDLAQTEVVANHVAQVREALLADHSLAMIADELEALGNGVVISDQDAPFAGMNVLVIVEAVDSHIC